MAIEINFEALPSDSFLSGPPLCPPERTASWIKNRLETASAEAEEKGGRIVGFIIKKADVQVPDENLGTIVSEQDHLFIASEIPTNNT